MRVRSRVLFAACATLSLFAAVQFLSTSASARNQAATRRVIVVLRNQDTAQPATASMLGHRRASFRASQSGVLASLRSSGARILYTYSLIDAIAAKVSPAEESTLRSNSAVREVIADQVLSLAPPPTAVAKSTRRAHAAVMGSPTTPVAGACAPDGQVELGPEATVAVNADSDVPGAKTARSLGITGAGVKVAYFGDGIDVNNPDFIRANGEHVFFDNKDFTGFGTSAPDTSGEAFIDASAIAAQGRVVYDVSHFSDLPLNQPCKLRIEGVAPGASLANMTVFGGESGFNSAILEAIDYAVTTDHVNVLNESFGNNSYPDDEASLDLTKQADDAAVAAGATVVVSSGDAGITNTIGTPATDPNVISVGASTTYRFDAQTGYGGARFPGVTGWLSNNISSLSSSGVDQFGRTIDLVAPGELNYALCTPNTMQYEDCADLAGQPSSLEDSGGTSESAPTVAGIAALVIQAYRQSHGGASPSPALVKQLIVSNTDDIGAPGDQQGAGLADAYKAVLAAEAYGTGAKTKSPSPVMVDSSSQLNAVAATSTPETFTDTVSNPTGSTEHLSLSTRALGDYSTLKTATVNLSDSSSPHMLDWGGIYDNYETVTFSVPSGENRLNASIAYQNVSATDLRARVRLTLVDPNGKLASYDVPQGDGNYGTSQVTNPAAGTWTAYIYSRDSEEGGTTGPVVFGASAAQYRPFGQVMPSSLSLSPGQSRTFTVNETTPATPRDTDGAVVINANSDASSTSTTIPITLRSLIPTGNSQFTGTLTGGNGRATITGQENFYEMQLPAGDPELNAVVTLNGNPNNPFDIWLVDPEGQAVAFSSNTIVADNGSGLMNLSSAQLHVLSPQAGTWKLLVGFQPQVSGTALSTPFTVATNQSPVPATATGVPSAASTQLTAGTPYHYVIRVKNVGNAQEAFFLDARLPGTTQLQLGSLSGSSATSEPLTVLDNIPEYLVPTHSTSLTETASTSGTQPLLFDSSAPAGDPDLASSTGLTASLTTNANPLSQGPWAVVPVEAGAFGAEGGPTESVNTSATVATSPFDTTVSSPTGDFQADSADPATSLGNLAPVRVGPGQVANIPVTFTPSGSSGTKVSGTLYVDDFQEIVDANFLDPIGNEVAAFPYSYTIK